MLRRLTDLSGRQDGDEILVDEPDLLEHPAFVVLALQLLDGEPEQHVLLAVLETQELTEHAPPHCTQQSTQTLPFSRIQPPSMMCGRNGGENQGTAGVA